MAIVTPPDNPAGVESLADLDGTDFVLCDPSAPCGAVSAEILSNAGVTDQPVSLEDKVTAVLSKVTLGEADAGMVYVSDAQGAGGRCHDDRYSRRCQRRRRRTSSRRSKDAPNVDAAGEWIDLVMSTDGQDVLASYGFGPPAS